MATNALVKKQPTELAGIDLSAILRKIPRWVKILIVLGIIVGIVIWKKRKKAS